MNLIELEKEIDKLDIKKQFFGFNKKPLYEGHYIIKENKWRVYYCERGYSNLLKEFGAESEAADKMKKEGKTSEEIARIISKKRNDIKFKFS